MVLEKPWAQKEMSWAFEKTIFQCFCKYLSDQVEAIFCESETKYSKLFKSKFCHRKLLRKWSWSYLELKNECSERLKRAFFSFLQIFDWRSWNRFLEKRGDAVKTFSLKSTLMRAFWEVLFGPYLMNLGNVY